MTLTVETGEVVVGANTYIDLQTFQNYCDSRGRDWSSYSDEQQEAAILRAADYLNNLNWKGARKTPEQSMCWPRYGLEIGGTAWNQLQFPATSWVGVLDKEGWYLPTDKVPPRVVQAQQEGAWLELSGTNLQPNMTSGYDQVIREKVDVIEIAYATGSQQQKPRWMIVENLICDLLKNSVTMEITRA